MKTTTLKTTLGAALCGAVLLAAGLGHRDKTPAERVERAQSLNAATRIQIQKEESAGARLTKGTRLYAEHQKALDTGMLLSLDSRKTAKEGIPGYECLGYLDWEQAAQQSYLTAMRLGPDYSAETNAIKSEMSEAHNAAAIACAKR